jgi:hypothetical protein
MVVVVAAAAGAFEVLLSFSVVCDKTCGVMGKDFSI